jgi:hypothetical protein
VVRRRRRKRTRTRTRAGRLDDNNNNNKEQENERIPTLEGEKGTHVRHERNPNAGSGSGEAACGVLDNGPGLRFPKMPGKVD